MKLKKTLPWTTIALGTLFATISCNNSDTFPSSDGEEIRFYVKGIAGMQTRAGYDSPSDITASDPGFGIYLVDSGSEFLPDGNRADNHQVKWDGTSWFDNTVIAGGTPMLWPENHSISINAYAYCPFINPVPDINNLPVKVLQDQSTTQGVKESDFLYATTSGNNVATSSYIPLTFQHQFSKIRLKVTYENTPGNISSVKVKAVITGTYNLASGSLTSIGTTVQDISAYCGETIEAIVLPQTLPSAHPLVSLSVMVNEKQFDYQFSLGDSPLTLLPNTIYNFNLRLKVPAGDNQILPDPISIEEWGATEEKGDFITDKSYKGLNPLKVSFDDFRDQTDGLSMWVKPAYELYSGSSFINIAVDGQIYRNPRGWNLSTNKQTTELSTYQNKIGGKVYKLSFYQWDNGKMVLTDTLRTANQTLVFSPQEVFIPTSILITPSYNPETKILTLTSSQPVPFPVTYRISQNQSGLDQDLSIPEGMTAAGIDLSSCNPDYNVLVTHHLTSSETGYSRCNFLSDGYFFVLIGDFWGQNADGSSSSLHVILN